MARMTDDQATTSERDGDGNGEGAPKQQAPALDIRDVHVIKHGRGFLLTDDRGDVPEGNTAALGLYFRDTRFLSRYELSLNHMRPLVLHSSAARNYAHDVELAYPYRWTGSDGLVYKENLALSRSRVLGETLMERLHLQNFGKHERELRLELAFEADFLDIFEVRGMERDRRGQRQQAHVRRNEVQLGYRGLDGVGRTTTLRFSPQPAELTEDRAVFHVTLAPGEDLEVVVEIQPAVGEAAPARRTIREARERLERDYSAWRKRSTRFRTSNSQLSSFLERAVLDLRMLLSEDEEGRPFLDAGVPWYSALFGRDSLITAYQCLMVNPDLAWATLDKLAALQGKKEDPEREEEPGKILHELRVGEMAGTGEVPHTPYYGAIDSTPLWLMVLASAYAWTGDRQALDRLWPNAQACLDWIDSYGDRDGDGFVEYEKVAPGGLDNQGWKDSHDAIVHPDGTKAATPIALVEVQAYVYNAKVRTAELAGCWATTRWPSASRKRRATSGSGSTASSGWRRGLLRAGARRRQATGRDAHVEPGPRAVVRHRRRGQGRQGRPEAAVAGPVVRLRDPDARRPADAVRPHRLSHGQRVAARLRAHRAWAQAVRVRRGGHEGHRPGVARGGALPAGAVPRVVLRLLPGPGRPNPCSIRWRAGPRPGPPARRS